LCRPAALLAQAPPTPQGAAGRTAAPRRIDGRLDDAGWTTAKVIEGFKQREPDERLDASEATSVRVLYDDANLYIGAELTDSDAAAIRSLVLKATYSVHW